MKALDVLKANSPKDALILVIDDAVAKKVIFAWTNLFPEYKDFEAEGMTLKEVLVEAWKPGIVDFDMLSRIAGLPRRTVEEKIVQLATSRLIFPDGTASELALKVIETEIAAKLRKIVGKPRGGA